MGILRNCRVRLLDRDRRVSSAAAMMNEFPIRLASRRGVGRSRLLFVLRSVVDRYVGVVATSVVTSKCRDVRHLLVTRISITVNLCVAGVVREQHVIRRAFSVHPTRGCAASPESKHGGRRTLCAASGLVRTSPWLGGTASAPPDADIHGALLSGMPPRFRNSRLLIDEGRLGCIRILPCNRLGRPAGYASFLQCGSQLKLNVRMINPKHGGKCCFSRPQGLMAQR